MLRNEALGGGASEEDAWWLAAFYGAALLVAFVVALFTCVCNPKSKRFSKHRSFILSHDLPAHEVPPTNVDHLAITSVVVTSSSSGAATSTIQTANAQCSVHHHHTLSDVSGGGQAELS